MLMDVNRMLRDVTNLYSGIGFLTFRRSLVIQSISLCVLEDFYLFIFIYSYLFERQSQREVENRESFHVLTHLPNGHTRFGPSRSQGQGLNPGLPPMWQWPQHMGHLPLHSQA